jgi:undecaprenyl-diphosphatase
MRLIQNRANDHLVICLLLAYEARHTIGASFFATINMDILLILKAIIMGIVEGLTEFLPISSTGHLIVAGTLLGFPQRIADTFEIFIQLGAILAVIVFFARDLLSLLRSATHDESSRRLLIAIVIAFVPAAAIGFLFNKLIKSYLFNPFSVGAAMIIGGILILVIERWCAGVADLKKTSQLERVSFKQALTIGVAQILSLIPGMSRSATTIMGGMLAGLDRLTALRFSFYLSIPTLVIASLYSLYKDAREGLVSAADMPVFGIGLIVSFIVAMIVIRFFLSYVARKNLAPFAWYRIAVGALLMAFTFPR